MLKEISVKNLGCFDEKEYKIDFSEETLIAGPNNSGKSMFFAGMNLLRYFVVTNGGRSWISPFYNLVGKEEAVYNHETERDIMISVTLIEGSTLYNYNLKINKGNWELKVNDQSFVGTSLQINPMKKILFFSPIRSPVRYTSSVQSTATTFQELNPDGSNVINFLLEKFTAQDENWNEAQSWLKKIDQDMSKIRTPIIGNQVSFQTMYGNLPVNVSLQGSGFQNASTIMSGVIFSPIGSTIIIEEPEIFLHPKSQEIVVDMINNAVNNHGKQVIFSTHSMNMLLAFWSDVGCDPSIRGREHTRADSKKFSMWIFNKVSGKVSIEKYPLHTKTFKDFRDDFKFIWG
jgi:predicted ATPase